MKEKEKKKIAARWLFGLTQKDPYLWFFYMRNDREPSRTFKSRCRCVYTYVTNDNGFSAGRRKETMKVNEKYKKYMSDQWTGGWIDDAIMFLPTHRGFCWANRPSLRGAAPSAAVAVPWWSTDTTWPAPLPSAASQRLARRPSDPAGPARSNYRLGARRPHQLRRLLLPVATPIEMMFHPFQLVCTGVWKTLFCCSTSSIRFSPSRLLLERIALPRWTMIFPPLTWMKHQSKFNSIALPLIQSRITRLKFTPVATLPDVTYLTKIKRTFEPSLQSARNTSCVIPFFKASRHDKTASLRGRHTII